MIHATRLYLGFVALMIIAGIGYVLYLLVLLFGWWVLLGIPFVLLCYLVGWLLGQERD